MFQKKLIKSLIISSLIIGLTSCSNSLVDSGSLGVKFKFPKKSGFSLKLIPNNTDSIKIEVKEKDNNDPIKVVAFDRDSATKDGDGNLVSTFLIKDIPQGEKEIIAKALDENGKVLAESSSSVDIIAGKKVQAILELQKIIENLSVKLNGLSSEVDDVFAEVVIKDGKSIFQKFVGDTLDLKDIPLGKVGLKATVFNKHSIPIATVLEDINLSNENKAFSLNVKPLVIPNKIPLGQIDNLDVSNVDSVQKILPTDLIKLLTNSVISQPDNTPPQFKDIELSISQNSSNETVKIKPGQSIDIDTETNLTGDLGNYNVNIVADFFDEDNDNVGFLWGIISEENKNYDLTLINDYDNEVSFSFSNNKSRKFLSLILTDKKSFVGPIFVPINIK